MIIKMNDGQELDTDKMDDLKAILMEKSVEIQNLCNQNNLQCLIFVEKIVTTYHMCPREWAPEKIAEPFAKFFWLLNNIINQLSGNRFMIGYMPHAVPQQPPPLSGDEWRNADN